MKVLKEGSSAQLLVLVVWYFVCYVLTGIAPKVMTEGLFGVQKVGQYTNLYFSTMAGSLVCLSVALTLGWGQRFSSQRVLRLGPVLVPAEFLYLLPSGVCTAIIIPTTTMMYSFGVSVMLAMVVMRGCVIVIGRAVDAILINRGLSTKRVSWEENVAVLFAVTAVLTAGLKTPKPGENPFSLFESVPAMVTLGLYVSAYFLRILIMNWKKSGIDKTAFFAAEQSFASLSLLAVGSCVLLFGPDFKEVTELRQASQNFNWLALVGGLPFGLAAFPSVFILMFKGRSGTFSTLANRLTSLVGGTVSTLVLAGLGAGKYPVFQDWLAFGLVLVAVGFLVKAERRQTRMA